ncbi:MAG: fumarylacetoacetate hydrolase family protein [Variibacter sp.]|nr:fumarylacetoacetate hydrolase family protein [Variibacter sp.]
MKWCRFKTEGGSLYGIIEDDQVFPVEGTPFGPYKKTGLSYPLASVKLDVPVVPGTFYCVGVNYADHIRRMAEKRGAVPMFPQKPDIGYRANNALIAHEENIVKPAGSSNEFQYEGELVAVLGRKAKKVSREEALDCVLGWTIGNDVSERTWQTSDRTLWRAKNADTFKPMGPWIVTGLDPTKMRTTIRLNGRVTDTFDTGNMIFDVATYISEVSQYCTLYPGDVMWMGTDGVPQNMKVGDTIEIEISGIGTLRNYVVAET